MAYGVPADTASEEIVRETVWLFVSVTLLIALVWPTTTLPKATEVGESVVGPIPVPLSATVFGLFEALVATDSDPAGTAPSAVGVRVSAMLHWELAATVPELGHVVPVAKAYPPVGKLIESMVSGVNW